MMAAFGSHIDFTNSSSWTDWPLARVLLVTYRRARLVAGGEGREQI